MRVASVFLLLLLAACTSPDRPGTWQPTGVNAQNLRAMLVDQDHLNRGIGTSHSRAVTAVAPIARLDAGERRALPEVRSSSVRIR
jgi:hypothetical protein